MDIIRKGGEVTDALNGKLTFEQSKNRIVGKDSNNVARLLISAANDEFVMKISEDNIDVISADEDELIFNSNNNLFKIVESGQVTLAMPTVVNGTDATVTQSVPHSLGYSPLVISFISLDSPVVPGLTTTRLFGGASVNAKSVSTTSVVIGYLSDEKVEASNTAVLFTWKISNATGVSQAPINGKVKYYLLTETAN
jgi:hypothetical protein